MTKLTSAARSTAVRRLDSDQSYMSPRAKLHFGTAVAVLVLAFILNWLVTAESSPLANYLLWHVGPANMWGGLNFFPYVVALIASMNSSWLFTLVFYVAFCIQWLLVGLILSFVLLLFRFKRDEPTTIC
jgi:hypothetical protein